MLKLVPGQVQAQQTDDREYMIGTYLLTVNIDADTTASTPVRRTAMKFKSRITKRVGQIALLFSMLGLTSPGVFATEETADTPESDAIKSEECLKFEADIDADLGEVLKAGCKPTLAQMSALMDNPLGNVAMLFTQFDYYKMQDPESSNTAYKGVYTGIFQFPKKLNDDWNLINRVIWTVPSMPLDQDKIDDFDADQLGNDQGGGVTGQDQENTPKPIDLFDGRTTDLGDSYYVGLFTPSDPVHLEGGGKFLWGAGFDLGLPTAQEDILGTGKWLAGPSALALYMGTKWKVGGLVTHYWDFEGDSDREDVNMTNLQYIAFYSLSETDSIGASPNIICNWEASTGNECAVPLGMGYVKTVQMGKVPVRFGAELHYYVVSPDDDVSARWGMRFYMIPAAPSALFDWMG
jgi:hypothetical protein